jgi:hypothetical protein
MIFKYIDIKLFLISLSIGLFYIYISEEYRKVIVIYPTPDNIDKYQYKDKSDECFSYELNEVKCTDKYNEILIQR